MPLKFGITALEFIDVAQRVIVDGVPDFSRLDVVELVRDAVTDHFSVIELTLDAKHIIPGSLTPETIDRLLDLKDELGHSYTVHLPLWSVELATFNEYVRQGSVDSTTDSIELTKGLEPEAYVLHATGDLVTEFSDLRYRPDLARLIGIFLAGFATSSIEDIISRTEIEPRKLAIENYKFPFGLMREMIDDLDMSICFDTAHLLTRMSGTESIMEFYRAHRDRIAEIHLQDATYTEYEDAVALDDHIALGNGIMGDKTLREFLTELLKDKFEGPIIFELSRDEAKESQNHIRQVVPEVFD